MSCEQNTIREEQAYELGCEAEAANCGCETNPYDKGNRFLMKTIIVILMLCLTTCYAIYNGVSIEIIRRHIIETITTKVNEEGNPFEPATQSIT